MLRCEAAISWLILPVLEPKGEMEDTQLELLLMRSSLALGGMGSLLSFSRAGLSEGQVLTCPFFPVEGLGFSFYSQGELSIAIPS